VIRPANAAQGRERQGAQNQKAGEARGLIGITSF
jgi:hypothetical protein